MCLRRFFGPSHSISAHILEDHVRWFISIEFGVVESGHNRTGRGKILSGRRDRLFRELDIVCDHPLL